MLGERVEHYDLLGELAEGGMATVYLGRRATQAGGGSSLVAIKSMRQELAADDAFLAMFLDEATLTARIKHPNVVPTLDVVSADGRLLIVMEYVEGVSLAKLLEIVWSHQAAIPPAIAIAVLCDVLLGLHAAHELVDDAGRPLHVVHRDVSPQNILVGVDGVARILDFGIAKAASQRHVTAQGEIKGKLAYMPPEQQFGERVDRRSDVYAAGVVLWEMLVGRRLFLAASEEELVRQVFEGRIEPPSHLTEEPLSPDVDRVVLRALSLRPEERWWSADQMAKELASAMTPATRSQVAAFVREVGRPEIEQRARHVQELLTPHALEAEAQIVLEVLTGERKRPRDLQGPQKPGISGPGSRSAGPSPAPRPHTHGSVAPGSRRARRRARRRTRMILLLGGIGLGILVLMTVALLLGMGWAGRS